MMNDFSELNIPENELFSFVEHESLSDAQSKPYSYWKSVAANFFASKANIVLLSMLAVIVIFAYIYPLFSEYDRFSNLLVSGSKHLSPGEAIDKYGFSIKWIFGTGANGESTFDKVWEGARISLSLAFVCGFINIVTGVIVGAFWGMSKRADMILTQFYNVISNVPFVLLVSVVLMIFNPGFGTMVFALTVTGWVGIAYEIRTQTIIIRDREYNTASRSLGTSTHKIVLRNILPHLISIIVTVLAVEIPLYISYEVFLSYIGIGMPEMSLGRIIYEAEGSMFTPGWQMEFWSPVVVACIVTVVLYVTGQHLGDASDPKTHM